VKWAYSATPNGPNAPSADANPTVHVYGPVACGTTTGGAEVTVDGPGSTGYKYQTGSMEWHFNWKTKDVPNGCYYLQVSSPTYQVSPVFPIQLK
jgi:hypothetical protein